MAEGVVSKLAVKLLEELGSQVFQETNLAFGVQDEIEKLRDTVSTIKDVLADADNAPVTELLRRLKDALYDADDLFDDFATQLIRRKVMTGNKITKEVRIFFSGSNQIAYGLEMSHKIKAVREKLENIKKDNEFNNLKTSVGKRVDNTSEREEIHSRRPELVIGRDEDKKKIIKLLLESNDTENVSFIPIVGMGGLGKTALAKLVYNDKQVLRHFQSRMWVCVSKQFNVEVIVENIMESATKKKPENLQKELLQTLLLELIGTKKYLLVLDDIWNEDPMKWFQLKDLLINGRRGSKILVTTRSRRAAKIVNKHLSYDLKGLNKDKSWSLFSQVAFERGIGPEDSKELVKIGEEIVEKCGGVPLVISTIGSLLSMNITEDYWSSFRDNELSKRIKEESDIIPILKLSYDHLPLCLKQCFAYCALFPKDYVINKERLIYLWMAQGFLQSSNNCQFLKDVGDQYFVDLLSRYFFQDPEFDEYGEIITCKMHNLMHDLAKLVGGVEYSTATLSKNYSVDERCRHVSLNCRVVDPSWKFSNELLEAKHIRTLLLTVEPYKANIWSNHKLDGHHEILSNYRYLRTLVFSEFDFDKLSSSISKLKHLRYLSLSKNYGIKRLPNSILRLKNLEILDLSYCKSLLELPKNIGKMVRLKDVIIKGCYSLIGMPNGLSVLSNLQTLSLFVIPRGNICNYRKYGALEELCGLKSLRGELTIRNLEHLDNTRVEYLENKQFLKFLKLEWHWRRSAIDGRDEMVLQCLKPHPNLKEIKIDYFMGMKLSNWLSSLVNVISISLSYCKRCQHIPPLNELPHLKTLLLRGLDDLECVSDEESGNCCSTPVTKFFPELEQLTLSDCPELKGWWRRDVLNGETTAQMTKLISFPRLSKLIIEGCPKLISMPLYPSLEELFLRNTNSMPLLQGGIRMDSEGPSSSSSFLTPLSKLKSLAIERVTNLDSLPEMWLQNFTSLVDLTISSCQTLSQLPRGIGYLTSLQKLKIESCHNMCNDEDEDYMQWQGLTSLNFVKFYWLQKLESLPKGLQHVTSLEYLDIEECPNLMALPGWLSNFTSLQQLSISDCPYLSETCGNEKRQDWEKIKHIQNIIVDSRKIKSVGEYLILNKEEISSKALMFSPFRVLQDS